MNKSMYKMPGLIFNSFFLKKEPISIIHFVTNRCNARCEHCFVDINNQSITKNELSLDEIERMTKTFGKSLFNVNLTGGEPFLRKDMFDIAKSYFTNTNIQSLFITTNGFFTDRIQDFLESYVSSNIKGKVTFQFSIDNFEEEHDKNRKVEGLFRKVLDSYHLVKSYKNVNIMPNICITLAHHNYNNVLKLYTYLKSLGIDSCTATMMREAGVVKKIDADIKKKLLSAYIELTKIMRKDQLSGVTKGFEKHFQGRLMNSKNILVSTIVAETYKDKKFIVNCSAASLFGVIYANGDVYPCEILSDKDLGNLRDYDMDFMKLWKNKQTNECKEFIKRTKCNCTYECVWSVNTISNPQFIVPMLYNAVRF
jgi:radical SAM protein with 4Fe4S-binding SPASM domain